MITLFSSENCGKCNTVKQLLSDKNITYKEIDVKKDFKTYADLINKGIKTIPVMLLEHDSSISKHYICQFEDILTYINENYV